MITKFSQENEEMQNVVSRKYPKQKVFLNDEQIKIRDIDLKAPIIIDKRK
jgi:hypothetical protein